MLKEIDKFLRTFGGQLDANDIADPLDTFATFNQFFYRKLKPRARPIAEPTHDHVVVSTYCCCCCCCCCCSLCMAWLWQSLVGSAAQVHPALMTISICVRRRTGSP